MAVALYLASMVLVIVALCGNYACGKRDNIRRSFLFDFCGGVAAALAYAAGAAA